jgi:DMSO/TMAO reductase YedYZ molybdopterin-dependent catalytic subunit
VITPADLFFVRDHFPEPDLLVSSWRLKVEGRVARTLELSLADVLEQPLKQLEALLECAGNAAGGTAMGNAFWEGVSLGRLLEAAGAARDAVAAAFVAADTGRLRQDSPHRPESLLAWKLNGRFLPHKDGFPLRALFPGWYGMDSVKWLQRIVVLGPSDEAPGFQASGMNRLYNRMIRNQAGAVQSTHLTEVLVKSVIAWPTDNCRGPRSFFRTHAGLSAANESLSVTYLFRRLALGFAVTIFFATGLLSAPQAHFWECFASRSKTGLLIWMTAFPGGTLEISGLGIGPHRSFGGVLVMIDVVSSRNSGRIATAPKKGRHSFRLRGRPSSSRTTKHSSQVSPKPDQCQAL